MVSQEELLGLSEAADLLRTTRQVVSNWRQRRTGFPNPVADLKSGPVWRRGDILAWAQENDVPTADETDGVEPKTAPASVVSLINMKGGVGKSTLTANLGWYCAYRKNMRVLLIDLDPQFNLSQYVMGTAGYEEHIQEGNGTILDIFERSTPASLKGKSAGPENVVGRVRTWSDGSLIDLVPSSLDLSWTLKNPSGKEQYLARFVEELRSSYDLVLVDCAPTESMLTAAAYLASDSVLIPVKLEFLSTIGLPLVVRSLAEFEERYTGPPEVLGILFNATGDKGEHDRSRGYVRDLAKQHGWYVFANELEHSDSYPKGSRMSRPIFLTDYARQQRVTNFYTVAEEFLKRLEP